MSYSVVSVCVEKGHTNVNTQILLVFVTFVFCTISGIHGRPYSKMS